MTKVPQTMLLGGIGLLALSFTSSASAQSAPSGPHPRIWLNASMLAGLRSQSAATKGPLQRASARCVAARENPSEYSQGGWQGFEFVTTLSSCLATYLATGGEQDLSTAIKYWRVLLDDYQTVGDAKGGDDVVTHDTGYAMRTFAPYSALAYDWLHDAPGVTEELRAHARARFHAWSTYYSTSGYLRDQPGANYHAGYAFAATLIAVAEAGEAGPAGEAHWQNVRDVIWQRGMATALSPGGVLDGGDWPEGWQYGSLSVLELSLAARAMQDSGLKLDGVESWTNSLPLRFAHGLTPKTLSAFTGGDSDASTPYRAPVNGALLATLLGPASDVSKALARSLNTQLRLDNENPLFDVLAAASSGEAAPLATAAPTSYLARGAGNWYVRGAWTPDTVWSVFQCSRQLVDDHQYANAGNWVLTRGGDDLVVDPSPYGSRSTLTGNAPAVDSTSLPNGYSPSQGYWGEKTGFAWSRQSTSGVAAARCEYADQFRSSDVPSGVARAVRDFVLVPQGSGAATVVLIDRAHTGAAERALHLRVRTPAALALSGKDATATLGSSSLAIRKLWPDTAAPNVRAMPQAEECPSSDHGCDVSKLKGGSEFRTDVTGPDATAVHVVSAGAGAPTGQGTLLSGVGYRGAWLEHATQSVAVIAGDTSRAEASPTLTYRVPAKSGAVHVVLDAPASEAGQSDVNAVLDGADCKVEIKPHVGSGPGIEARPLIVHADSQCVLADGGEQPPVPVPVAVGDGSDVIAGPNPGAGAGPSVGAGPLQASSGNPTPAAPSPGAPSAEASCALRPFGRRSAPITGGLATALGLLRFCRRRRVARRVLPAPAPR